MAEIQIQRKRSTIWPGLIAVLAVLLLVWLVAETWFPGEEEFVNEEAVSAPAAPDIAPTTGTTPTPPPEVAAFMTFAAEAGADTPAAGPAHDYTAAGLRRLTAALDAIVREQKVDGQNVRDRLQAFRRTAEQIQANPEAAAHSNQVREAFAGAADLMTAMQQNRWPDAADIRNSVEQVRTAAGAIEGNRPLLEQTSNVRQFFVRSAAAMRQMIEQT